MRKLFNETLLLKINESALQSINNTSNDRVILKFEKLKPKLKDSYFIVFRASVNDKNFIDINVVELQKYGKEKKLEVVNNVFSYDEIKNIDGDIECSFHLADKFQKIFNKSKIKHGSKNAKYYFTFHDRSRGLNLATNQWEKFI